jgi:acetyl-CoA acetyltransferase
MKGGGRAPPPSPAWANCTLMMECTPESSRYYSVYSVVSEATRLGAIAIEAAVRQAGVDKAAVDEAYLGVAVQAGLGQAPARQAVIYAGLPVHVVSTTINKVINFCSLTVHHAVPYF